MHFARLFAGQAEQWGSVKPKKQQKKETSSIETSHDGQASTSAASGRGSFGGRGRGRGGAFFVLWLAARWAIAAFAGPDYTVYCTDSTIASRSLQTSEADVVDSEVVLEEDAVVPSPADSQQMEKSQ